MQNMMIYSDVALWNWQKSSSWAPGSECQMHSFILQLGIIIPFASSLSISIVRYVTVQEGCWTNDELFIGTFDKTALAVFHVRVIPFPRVGFITFNLFEYTSRKSRHVWQFSSPSRRRNVIVKAFNFIQIFKSPAVLRLSYIEVFKVFLFHSIISS